MRTSPIFAGINKLDYPRGWSVERLHAAGDVGLESRDRRLNALQRARRRHRRLTVHTTNLPVAPISNRCFRPIAANGGDSHLLQAA
jgi:hypothetical protein